jgi:hypothetical protein
VETVKEEDTCEKLATQTCDNYPWAMPRDWLEESGLKGAGNNVGDNADEL